MKSKEFDISFQSENMDRNAFRTSLPGITVRYEGRDFPVKDLSATGVSLVAAPLSAFGQDRPLDLYVSGRLYLAQLRAQLVRGSGDFAAFSFVNLNQQQEFRLDKLVLSIQKQLIELRKIHGESD